MASPGTFMRAMREEGRRVGGKVKRVRPWGMQLTASREASR
jgi:hypothetical protein